MQHTDTHCNKQQCLRFCTFSWTSWFCFLHPPSRSRRIAYHTSILFGFNVLYHRNNPRQMLQEAVHNSKTKRTCANLAIPMQALNESSQISLSTNIGSQIRRPQPLHAFVSIHPYRKHPQRQTSLTPHLRKHMIETFNVASICPTLLIVFVPTLTNTQHILIFTTAI